MITVSLKGICKSFGPVEVLKDISLTIEPGKVHVLLGENGAGKSTLIKILSGVYAADAGEILIDGNVTKISNVREAQKLGIATIHQELQLVPSLSVAENLLLGRLPKKAGFVDYKELNRQAEQAMARIGLKLNPSTKVSSLGIAQQQLVEIAKALALDSKLLILDEPTAALTQNETEVLFELMNQLREAKVGMVFISHHLNELAEIGDTVSVLRDGHLVAQVPASTPENELVKLMVGRSIDEQYPRQQTNVGEVMLNVDSLTSEGKFKDVSFQVRAGEVLGIAGLVGAGRTEVLRAIAGVDPYQSGSITVRDKPLKKHSIRKSIAAGVALVPEDRKAQGLVLSSSVAENIGYSTLYSTAKLGFVDRAGQRAKANDVSQKLRVRLANINQHVKELSGGNQQKVVFGKWVAANSKILLLDEPTRGVDVGAKVEIYELINQITASGGAVVMVSSELPEVLGMSDRILVMSEGRVSGEVPAEGATQDQIMMLAVANTSEDLHSITKKEDNNE